MSKKKKLNAIFVALVLFCFIAFFATVFLEAKDLECEDFSKCYDDGGCDGLTQFLLDEKNSDIIMIDSNEHGRKDLI